MPPGAKEAVSNDSSVGIVQFVQIEDSFVQFSPSPLVGAVGAQILLNLQQALASVLAYGWRALPGVALGSLTT